MCIGAPLVLVDYKEDDRVRCASPIFMLIAYYLGFTNSKRKYFEEKTTATLKSKQTSIATVRNHLRTLASFPIPLIFHWSLPLTNATKTNISSQPSLFCRTDKLLRNLPQAATTTKFDKYLILFFFSLLRDVF